MATIIEKLPKLALPMGLAAFAGLFLLGQFRDVWLPFWMVGTLGAGGFVLWLAIPAFWQPRRLWAESRVRGVIETAAYVAVAGYTFWISLGHLLEELAHL